MENINCILYNSGEKLSFKGKETNPIYKKMIKVAMKEGKLELENDITIKLEINEQHKSYRATFYAKVGTLSAIILETGGSFNDEGGQLIWKEMQVIHNTIVGEHNSTVSYPGAPIVCAFVLPTIFALSPAIQGWIISFSMWLGIEVVSSFNSVKNMGQAFVVCESLKDIPSQYVSRGDYKGIPKELEPFQYWLADSGNVIMAIPECLFEQAVKSGKLDSYEAGVSCSYVLKKGYRFYENHVIVDVPYDNIFGVQDMEIA